MGDELEAFHKIERAGGQATLSSPPWCMSEGPPQLDSIAVSLFVKGRRQCYLAATSLLGLGSHQCSSPSPHRSLPASCFWELTSDVSGEARHAFNLDGNPPVLPSSPPINGSHAAPSPTTTVKIAIDICYDLCDDHHGCDCAGT